MLHRDVMRLCPCGKKSDAGSGGALLDRLGDKSGDVTSSNGEAIVAMGNRGQSCAEVCSEKGKQCEEGALDSLNNCEMMKKEFQCKTCEVNEGDDQPCLNEKGVCLLKRNRNHYNCNGRYSSTRRLCSCV